MEVDQVIGENDRNTKQQKLRKEKSRNAARNRRSKENLQYIELAKLLPLPTAITSQLDKASVIRLTISFLKYREMTGRAFARRKRSMLQPVTIGDKTISPYLLEKDLGLHLLQALDGFIFCVSQEGKFLYISETVSAHLGLSQLDLVGSSVFNFIHPDDHREFSELLYSSVEPNLDISFDDLDAMTLPEMMRKIKQGYISIFIRMKCALVKRGGCFVKSSGYKVIHVSGQIVPFKNVDHNGERAVALVATGQPLPPPTMCELKLDTKVFVSRVGMDLRIAFCEGKIRKYMNFTARDIVGISAYEFYHLNDMVIVQDAHSDCLNAGKCVSGVYRWMNKTGGWIWMQTVGTVLTRKTPSGDDESQILCVNYICSEVEEGDEVMHGIQQHFKALEITNKATDEEKNCLDDFGTEMPCTPSSDDLKASLAVSTMNQEPTGDRVFDKDSYLLSLKFNCKMTTANQSNSSNSQLPDDIIVPQEINIPNVNDHIPSWQETQAMDEASALATHLLMAEIEAENTPVKFPFDDEPLSPDSCLLEKSPSDVLFIHDGPPTLSSHVKNNPSNVFLSKSTNMPRKSNNGTAIMNGNFEFENIDSHVNNESFLADCLNRGVNLTSNSCLQNTTVDVNFSPSSVCTTSPMQMVSPSIKETDFMHPSDRKMQYEVSSLDTVKLENNHCTPFNNASSPPFPLLNNIQTGMFMPPVADIRAHPQTFAQDQQMPSPSHNFSPQQPFGNIQIKCEPSSFPDERMMNCFDNRTNDFQGNNMQSTFSPTTNFQSMNTYFQPSNEILPNEMMTQSHPSFSNVDNTMMKEPSHDIMTQVNNHPVHTNPADESSYQDRLTRMKMFHTSVPLFMQ